MQSTGLDGVHDLTPQTLQASEVHSLVVDGLGLRFVYSVGES